MERVLLIQLRQLGDILLTTPCIREIKRESPQVKIDFLCHRMGEKVLDGNPYVDRLYTYKDHDSVWDWYELIKNLRRQKYDVVIDFMNNPRSALLTLISGSPRRISFKSARFWAYNEIVPKVTTPEYIVNEKFRLLNKAGFSPKDIRLTLPWDEMDLAPFKKFLDEHGEFRESPLRVVMSPTHRREARFWPLTKYAQVAEYLVKEWQASVVWIYGPGEEDVIQEVMGHCHAPTLKAPPTSFRELAAFMANCDLFIGNSNGPSHIAVASDIPSLQIHGPTYAASWCPMNKKHWAVQSPDLMDGKIEAITVSKVIDQLKVMKPELGFEHRRIMKTKAFL